MSERKEYGMTDAQFDALMEACKPVAAIALNCGPLSSPQENANRAWCSLGREMGFDGMTARPSPRGERFFTAVPHPTDHSKGAM